MLVHVQTCERPPLHFHAAGHLLGLSHDDSKFCEERFGVNSDKRLMSSILTSIDASKPWSRCTSATITDFFDDGNGKSGSGFCARKAARTFEVLLIATSFAAKYELFPLSANRTQMNLAGEHSHR